MLLRRSEYVGQSNWDAVLEIAGAATGDDKRGYRAQFVDLVKAAKTLSPQRVGQASPTARF
jgi:Ca-activated chloride channel family protein